LIQCAIHPCQIEQLAPRDPHALDRIIPRPPEPEPLPSAYGHHPPRHARERAPQRHRRAYLRDEPRLQIERLAAGATDAAARVEENRARTSAQRANGETRSA